MAEDIHVKGLRDLQKLLDTLPAKMEANVMRGALRAGMKVVMPVAKSNISSLSGETAASLKITTSIRNGLVKSKLAAKGIEGMRAIWLEFGTQPHLIKVSDEDKKVNTRLSRKRGHKVLESVTTINRRSLLINQNFVGPVIRHPGAVAKPFMRPALDSQSDASLRAAAQYIRKRLEKKHGLDTSMIKLPGDDE